MGKKKAKQFGKSVIHPILIWVIAFAIGLTINYCWGPNALDGDEGDYYNLAVQFADDFRFGHENQVAYRAPLYPIALGFWFKVFGNSLWAARIFNSILAAFMATGAGLIAGKITKAKWPIYLAAGLLMLHSYWWLHQVVLMQENLAAALLVFCVVTWPVYGKQDRAVTKRIRKHGGWVVASGVLFGLSQLAKPTILPLLIGFPILSLLLSKSETRRTQMAFALLFSLTATLTISSWTIRNYSVMNQFVPITTGSGEVFWGAHAPETLSDAPGQWKSVELPDDLQKKIDNAQAAEKEILASRLRWNAGLNSLKTADPLTLGKHFVMKVLKLWSPSTFFNGDTVGLPVKVLLICINTIVLCLFAYSLFRPSSQQILILTIFLSITLTSLVFWGSIRFLYVAQPIVAGLAAQTVVRKLYRRQEPPTDLKRVTKRTTSSGSRRSDN